MHSTLLKTATLVLCLTAAGCSTFSHDRSDAKPEQASRHSWWPFGGDKAEAPATAKIDAPATQAWLDTYEPRLREALKGSNFEVERRENLLVVTAPVDSSFNVKRRPGMLMPGVLAPITQVAKLVETDPQTWLALLTGSVPFADAVADGRVRASGTRADLTEYLPL